MHNLDFARERADSICSSFSASYMSNAKWVKLLSLLASIQSIECAAEVKLVWDDVAREIRIDDSLAYNSDFYESSMEAMVSGYPKGWYDYKEIEWLSISAAQEQLKEILKHMNKSGKFEISSSENAIKIYAYKNI